MNFERLTDDSLVIIFAFSPVGFGHLRVTDALFHGLPKGTKPLLLGAQDASISVFYRFISIHPITRKIMELMQSGWGEDLFTYVYRKYVQSHTTLLYRQILTILDEQVDQPKTVLMVATHFGLAHQLAVVQKRIEAERNIKIFLVVQVTDDSPQYIWYIPNANMIFVPSEYTKQQLLAYAKKAKLPLTNIVVNPYPVSLSLGLSLSEDKFRSRKAQLDPQQSTDTHVIIPISGAAVGISWISDVMQQLHRLSERYHFHILAKQTPYTQKFLFDFSTGMFANIHTSAEDREVVDLYAHAFETELLSLEITKPSEQAFKALLSPHQRGGVILLFSEYVGKQEQDNIAFLAREGLIPSPALHKRLWSLAQKQEKLPQDILHEAKSWRGLVLPKDARNAAAFIQWCMKEKLLSEMALYTNTREKSTMVQPNGVERFWKQVNEFLAQEEEK